MRISGASMDSSHISEDFSLIWSKAKAGQQKVECIRDEKLVIT
jgi:hypothetical protein